MNNTEQESVSLKLEALLTRVDLIKEVLDRTSEKVDHIEQQGLRLDMMNKSAQRRLNELTPKVQELHDLKNRSQGVLIILSLLFGAFGSALLHVLN